MGTGSFPGVKYDRGVLLNTHPLLVPRSWRVELYLYPTLWATTGPVKGSLYLYYNKNYIDMTQCRLNCNGWQEITACQFMPNTSKLLNQTTVARKLRSAHLTYKTHSIEITNRCNCMQWILFLCLVHSTCFGRHTRPSSGVQLYLQPLVQS